MGVLQKVAGALADTGQAQQAQDAVRVISLTGELSLRELFTLMRKMRAFIGPDSGPTHIAASLGIPTLLLYSGTNEFDQWKSLSPSASFLRTDVYCAPCHRTVCPIKGHLCMAWIEPQKVLQWLDRELGNDKKGDL